ncbi:MAG: hypothetical protein V1789_07375 [PVC group bacterium]
MKNKLCLIVSIPVFLALLAPGELLAEEYGSHKTEIREGEPRLAFVSFNFPTEIVQGELVSASLFFRAIKPLEKPEKVFFHLVKPGRQETVYNADFFPRHSTLLWDVNQVVEAGPFELAIPDNLEPGEYEVRAGLMEIVREESQVRYVREPYINTGIKDFGIGKLTVTKTDVPDDPGPSEFDLVSFNNEQDIIFWETLGATVEFFKYDDEDEQSTTAAKVTILPGPGYPGVILENVFQILPRSGDWSLYDTLQMQFFVPAEGKAAGFFLQITDYSGQMFQTTVSLLPGKTSTIDLSMVDLSGKINVSSIMRVKLFVMAPSHPVTFYISRSRLISRGMPTGKPAVTFVRLEAPEKVKRGQPFRVRGVFSLDQPVFQTHKMFVHVYRVNDGAGRVMTDAHLTPPIRGWGLNQEVGVDSAPLLIRPDAPPGTYVVRMGLYLIAYTDGGGYVKIDDWNAYGGKEEVINVMQSDGPIDYIKQPYTNPDIQGWEVGTIAVE